jgi:uncharacterized protein (TIGR03089 family)
VSSPYAALRAALSADPSRPLLTYVGPEGRTELSARTLENNVAKAAGLLRDGLDVQPGDVVALLLPVHGQAAVWQGACWAVGAIASFDAEDLGTAVVALADADRLGEVGDVPEVLRVGRHPFGLPDAAPLPPGALEAATEMRVHSDVFTPYAEPAGTDAALRVAGRTYDNTGVMAAAAELAATLGLGAGGRLLVSADLPTPEVALALLAVPLAASAAVVVAPGSADESVVSREQVTARLR